MESLHTDKWPLLVAGPCSAESESQLMAIAEGIAPLQPVLFRAGLWKPRTRPGQFEGVGAEGLPWLKAVEERFGIPVATEVATPEHVTAVLDSGINAFWIGARTTTNPFAVQEIADTIAASGSKPTLLVKNPVSPDVELWIGAIERFMQAGVNSVVAVHRGFGYYGQTRYRNMPLWRIPIELKRRMPHIPLLCDPSHIGGDRSLIQAISQQAADLDFDGIMVETHCTPDSALSDGRQQVTPAQLAEIVRSLTPRNPCEAPGDLDGLRTMIDAADDELMAVLCRRMDISRQIGRYKREHGMRVVQPDRYRRLVEDRAAIAEKMGLDPSFVRQLLAVIHEESVRQQME